MKRSKGGLRRTVVAACAILASSACSTVIKNEAARENQAGAEARQALQQAAEEVARVPWPKPSSSSFADRIAGAGADGKRVSRDDAIKVYVAALAETADPETALMAEADRHLRAAGALMDVAAVATDSPSPRLSDVALIEDAISDLRETRAIYIASMKKLNAEDRDADRLKDSFDRVIKDLGEAADELAENAMNRRSENFAGSDAASAGSL